MIKTAMTVLFLSIIQGYFSFGAAPTELGEHSKDLPKKEASSKLALDERSGSGAPQTVAKTVVKKIATQESLVSIQGKKFRKIEVQKEIFFIEALDSTQSNSEIRVLCQQGRREILPAQVEVKVKQNKRANVVIEGIRQACKEASNGRTQIEIDPAVLLGLEINFGQDQSKQIRVTPIGLSFKVDW